jgi:hypothetical protein
VWCEQARALCPLILTAWWHLVHGNSIKWAGRAFHVPLRWYAKTYEGQVYISKFSSTVFSKGPSRALILLWPIETPPKTEAERDSLYQTFPSAYWNVLAGSGETTGPIRIGTGENEAVCMETAIIKDKWTSLACVICRGTWNATFHGEPKELDSFYAIIKSVK